MVLQTTGPISIGDIQAEFGGSPDARVSEYYSGGLYVPPGTTGTNGPIPSSGEVRFSDFYGSPIVQNEFKFIATNNGIHTVSLFIPRFGTWTDPLPEVPMIGNFGTDKDSNGIQDTTSGLVTMPDTFEYGCGNFESVSTSALSISLSRWNGSSFDNASLSWWPNVFNNLVINGPGFTNFTINKTAFTAISTGPLTTKELLLSTNSLSPLMPSSFVNGVEYIVTFT